MSHARLRRTLLVGLWLVFCGVWLGDLFAEESADLPPEESSPNVASVILNPAIRQPQERRFYRRGALARSGIDKNRDGLPDAVWRWRGDLKIKAWEDTDFDGRSDNVLFYNGQGKLVRKISDANHDGLPDQYQTFPGGSREFVWREYDRNGDNMIDKRVYGQWMPDRKMTVLLGSRVTQMPIPGYKTLMREEDDNFDGRIDVSYDGGVRDSKIGQSMDPAPRPLESEPQAVFDRAPSQGGKPVLTSSDEGRMSELNEKLDLIRQRSAGDRS